MSSGYRGKAAIVARLRPGTRTECWVNPANPGDAVIERGLTSDLWLGLIPLLFMIIGGAGTCFAAVGRGRFSGLTSSKPTTAGATYTKALRGAEPATLRTKYSRGARLAGFIVVALIWNGILCLFLYDLVSPSRHGSFQWFIALFLIPFILIGIGLVALAIRQALQLSNPRPKVTVSKSRFLLAKERRSVTAAECRARKISACRRHTPLSAGRAPETIRDAPNCFE